MATKSTKLSKAQIAALQLMQKEAAPTPSWKMKYSTTHALVRRGLIERLNAYGSSIGYYSLTAKGREALEVAATK